MPIDLVSQLASAAIRAAGLGLVAFTWLVAVSYPIFSRAARGVDSRTRRHAAANPFGRGGSNGPAEGTAGATGFPSTAGDESGANVRRGSANACDGE